MVPIDFYFEVLSVVKVSSPYHLWLVRSYVYPPKKKTASREFKTNLLEGLTAFYFYYIYL